MENNNAFPFITYELQKQFESQMVGTTDTTPDICGYYGRACRQLGASEGANRALCTTCPLARFVIAAELPSNTYT